MKRVIGYRRYLEKARAKFALGRRVKRLCKSYREYKELTKE